MASKLMAPKNEKLLKDLADKFRHSLQKQPAQKPVSLEEISNLKGQIKKKTIWNYLRKKGR